MSPLLFTSCRCKHRLVCGDDCLWQNKSVPLHYSSLHHFEFSCSFEKAWVTRYSRLVRHIHWLACTKPLTFLSFVVKAKAIRSHSSTLLKCRKLICPQLQRVVRMCVSECKYNYYSEPIFCIHKVALYPLAECSVSGIVSFC